MCNCKHVLLVAFIPLPGHGMLCNLCDIMCKTRALFGAKKKCSFRIDMISMILEPNPPIILHMAKVYHTAHWCPQMPETVSGSFHARSTRSSGCPRSAVLGLRGLDDNLHERLVEKDVMHN